MLHKKISARGAAVILTIALGIASFTGVYAWKAADAKPEMHPANYCISCHSDAKTLQAMKDKRGD